MVKLDLRCNFGRWQVLIVLGVVYINPANITTIYLPEHNRHACLVFFRCAKNDSDISTYVDRGYCRRRLVYITVNNRQCKLLLICSLLFNSRVSFARFRGFFFRRRVTVLFITTVKVKELLGMTQTTYRIKWNIYSVCRVDVCETDAAMPSDRAALLAQQSSCQ